MPTLRPVSGAAPHSGKKEGRYLILFVAQIIPAEIRATLREKNSDSKYSVESLPAILSTLNVLEYGGQRGLSEVTKNVRRVYELFDIEVPKEPLYHAQMFDPADLMFPVEQGKALLG